MKIEFRELPPMPVTTTSARTGWGVLYYRRGKFDYAVTYTGGMVFPPSLRGYFNAAKVVAGLIWVTIAPGK